MEGGEGDDSSESIDVNVSGATMVGMSDGLLQCSSCISDRDVKGGVVVVVVTIIFVSSAILFELFHLPSNSVRKINFIL